MTPHDLEGLILETERLAADAAALAGRLRAALANVERKALEGPPAIGPAGRLVQRVALASGISAVRLRGDDRTADAVAARQVAAWLLRERLGLSSTVAGQILGKDHSTILTGTARVDEEIRRRAGPRYELLMAVDRTLGNQEGEAA